MDKSVLEIILENLPHSPRDDYKFNPIWTEGDEILCLTEQYADVIADFLETVADLNVHTGYYDPEEDERSGEVDDHTGFWYIDFD